MPSQKQSYNLGTCGSKGEEGLVVLLPCQGFSGRVLLQTASVSRNRLVDSLILMVSVSHNYRQQQSWRFSSEGDRVSVCGDVLLRSNMPGMKGNQKCISM